MGKLEEEGGGGGGRGGEAGGGGVAAAQQGGQLTGARLGSGAAAPEGRVGVNLFQLKFLSSSEFLKKKLFRTFYGKFSCHARASIEYSRLNL